MDTNEILLKDYKHKLSVAEAQVEHCKDVIDILAKEITYGEKPAAAAKPAKTAAAKPAAPKKAAAPKEELQAPTEGEGADDLDAFLGEGPGDPAAGPTEDDLRALLSDVIKAKGAKGKEDCKRILATYTKKNSALIKDINPGALPKVFAAVQKLK